MPATERVRVHEIYASIQGESTRVGRACSFVRLTGCQMRCVWCDSEDAFYGGAWRTLDEVVDRVRELGVPLVEVTGGEPLLQPGCVPLLTRLCDEGYEVLLETGGGLDISEVDQRVGRIVDVKCPGSGEAEANHWPNLALLNDSDEVKFVLADEVDYRWACDVLAEHRLADRCPVLFSPVWATLEAADLSAWVVRDRLPVRVQVQLHKVIWGADATGV